MKKRLIILFVAVSSLSYGERVSVTTVDTKRIVSKFPVKENIRPERLDSFVHKISKGITLPYRFYRPEESKEKLPMVIFLHGIGEAGVDNKNQLKHAEPLAFINSEMQQELPCFFLAPQHPRGFNWGTISISNPSPCLKSLTALVSELIKENNIDPSRVYITGLSSGGWGAFDAVTFYPQVYAAATIVSSGADPRLVGARNQARPIWFSCNSNDVGVYKAVTESSKALAEMGYDVHISVAKNKGGHSAWEWAFFDQKMISWLFEQNNDQ